MLAYAGAAVVPFGRLRGSCPARRFDVELTMGRDLVVVAVLIASVMALMWVLRATRPTR